MKEEINTKITDSDEFGVPDHIRNVWELLGMKAVIVAVKPGTKQAAYRSWNSLSLDDMDNPKILNLITPNHNLAVSLGEASGGLCTIDCDSEEALAKMMELNPRLSETLLTRGKRGGNCWIRIKGTYPDIVKVPGFGEWRSNGGYTMLMGRHPDGMDYSVVRNFRPIEMAFEEINWPQEAKEKIRVKTTLLSNPSNSSEKYVSGISKTKKLESDKLETGTLNDCDASNCIPKEPEQRAPLELVHCMSEKPENSMECASIAYGNEHCAPLTPAPSEHCITSENGKITPEQVQENLRLIAEVESRYARWLKENQGLGRLYVQQIDRFHEAEQGGRNAMITKSVPRLYRAVSERTIVDLVMAFYDINKPYFSDSREQHEKETRGMIKLVAATYLKELTPDERAVYDSLHPDWQVTYRICRDLAITGDEKFGPCHFFMSCDQLKVRLGFERAAQAERILKRFKKARLIQAVGTENRRAREATTYAWCLPLPRQNAAVQQSPVKEFKQQGTEEIGAVKQQEAA